MPRLTTTQGLLVRFDDNWLCIALSDRGDEINFFRSGPTPSASPWIGFETRVDEQGREWQSRTKGYVIDDFGSLVEVPL